CALLVGVLRAKAARIEDVEIVLEPGKGHRFVAVLRGPGLSGEVSDADPHKEGKPAPPAAALAASAAAEKTARVVDALVARAGEASRGGHPANAVLLRGPSPRPSSRGSRERFKLKAGALAAYPMYRGVAERAGMDVLPAGETPAEAFAAAARRWRDFDYFF